MDQAPTVPATRVRRAYGHGQAAMRMDMPGMGDQQEIPNQPEQHAFVMLGMNTLFLCHLTMYGMEEHNYQIVLQGRLPAFAMEQYRRDRLAHPNNSYFLGNSPTDLFTVPDVQCGMRTFFLADVFRGIPQQDKYESWPWANQTPLIPSVRIEVERVVYFRHLSLTFQPPTMLTYALFGFGNEAHMTNWQTKSPGFDHVVSLAEAPDWLPQSQLQSSVHVGISGQPGTNLLCADPLPASSEGSPATCSVKYRGVGPDRQIKLAFHHWFCTKVCNDPNPDPCAGKSAPCGTPP